MIYKGFVIMIHKCFVVRDIIALSLPQYIAIVNIFLSKEMEF